MQKIGEKIKRVKMLLLDVDGVMTDGGVILGPGRIELKRFNTYDGLGIALAKAAGLLVGILTARNSEVVRRRAKELKIDEVLQGFVHKEEGYEAILKKYRLKDEEIAYVGDDLLDIPILKRAGLSICVVNGVEEAKRVSHYVTERKGGDGAVREIVELPLTGMGKREAVQRAILGSEKRAKK